MSASLTMHDPEEFRCAFCDGIFVVDMAMDAENTDEPVAVVHSVPPCQTFMRLDVVAFVREVRRAWEAR